MAYIDQYYKDGNGLVIFMSADNQQQANDNGHALPGQDWTPITAAEAAAALAPTLAQVQQRQVDVIDAAYTAAGQVAVKFTTAAGVTQTFQADSESQTVLMQASQGYSFAGATPDGFTWKAEDNTLVPFVLADLKGLFLTMLAQGQVAFAKKTTLKAQIAAATTAEAVLAVVWSTEV